jgi:acyl-CoA thioester hydrolase
MEPGTFRHTLRVRHADCTVGDHIYYSRYFELLEVARNEFFRQLGVTFRQWQDQDTIFPVVECHGRYRAPARYDDVLTIELRLADAGGIRLDFRYRILNQADTLILEARTLHVCTSIGEKPKRLPETLVAALQPYLSP